MSAIYTWRVVINVIIFQGLLLINIKRDTNKIEFLSLIYKKKNPGDSYKQTKTTFFLLTVTLLVPLQTVN